MVNGRSPRHRTFAKYYMAAIEPWCNHCGDEELTPVRVGTCVCHGQVARGLVLQVKILILHALSVLCAVVCSEQA